MTETRICPACKESIPLTEFYPDENMRRCKTCVRADINRRYTRRKEKTVTEEGILYANGAKYIGPVKNGKRHGQGKYIFVDGLVEHGFWREDLLISEEE